MYNTQKYHFIYFVDVLVNNEAVQFMNKKVQFVLTLYFIMLLGEYLFCYFCLSELMHSREHEYESNDDNHRLSLIGYVF